jgi:hypothetical protein
MIERLRDLVERAGRAPVVLRRLLPLAWAGLIWWLSSRTPSGSAAGFGLVFLFNGAHVVVFGMLAALLHLALPPAAPPHSRDAAVPGVARRFWWACALAAVYGAVDELHQAYVPGRVASVFDWTSDAVGAVLGAALMTWLRDRAAWAWRTGWWMVPSALVSVGCASVY